MNNEIKHTTEDLRHALIIAGIKEVELHGLTNFSLRRVASACGVSCAAPYRHFKSKDDLILAIISYINAQWSFLQNQIVEIYRADTKRLIVELSLANIRFWIANPNFRSIIMMDDKGLDALQLREKSRISDEIKNLIHSYAAENGISEGGRDVASVTILATIYGATQMLGSGELQNTSKNINTIKRVIERALEAE